ncbi:type I secretion system permease/ATPase [Vibrio hyugaensis]|uniref:type I secretion system permease/ATPase n=1 Tax=Vibrio hyugaensis TaxID=1534743 RepID=UPI000CE440F4|nr:ATP-binding cassette domain-containing protein [Vibrio hyugaensis]
MVQNSWNRLSPFTLKALGPMTLVSAAINALMLVVPIYSLQLFDRVLSSRSTDTLLLLTAIALFLLISQALLETLRQKYTQRKALQFESESAQWLYQLCGQHYDTKTRYVFNDITEIRSLLMSPGFFVAFDLPWTPLFLLVMFMLHPIIGLVGLIAVICVLVVALLSFYTKKKSFEASYATQIAANRKIDELFNKQETLISQQATDGTFNKFQPILAEKLWFRSKVDLASINLTSIAKLVRMTLQIGIMGTGAFLVIQNSMSAGGMIAGSILMARALQPIEQLTSGFQGWKTGLAAANRIKNVVNKSKIEPERITLPEVSGELRFDNVVWSPENHQGEPIIKQLKLRLETGNRVAIIGSSGSGKTSLCKLLMGIHKPTSGKVCIDGLNVTHWDKEQFKHTVGYLPQTIQFIQGSVKENIAHFDTEITDSQIIKAAIRAGVHETILQFPNSYETIIGDGGHQLSGGQAQKLALARALCFKPKLLVLDEPNSHMDKEGEEYLISLLATCREESVSVVMITHQPHLLRHVDWVIEINKGQIARAGEASKVLRSMMDVHSRTQTQSEASNE